MKILFINSLRKNRWGGGEKWMIEAADGLNKLGHHSTIACLDGSIIKENARSRTIQTLRFGIKSDISIWSVYVLKRFLKRENIDVLVCCQNKDVKIGGLAARKAGTKAIFSRQGLQLFTNKKRYKRPFTQLIDGIITNTKTIKNIYESFGWFPQNFIHVLYNGMPLPKINTAAQKEEIFKVKTTTKVIFSAGRLSEQKGFKYLIRAAKMCKEAKLDYLFFIAGTGKLENELKTLAQKENVDDKVIFLGFKKDLSAYYQTADVFVLPSLYEGMPNVVMESMAHGTPAIATQVNGADELITNGENGFLIHSESPEEIFDALQTYFQNPEQIGKMGIKARNHVAENFTTQIMSKKLEQLFTQQIHKHA